MHWAGDAMVGAIATLFHDMFLAPSDLIKQWMQLDKTLNFRKVLSDIFAHDGFKTLFRSYWVTVLMNMPNAAALVTTNENLKVLIKPEQTSYKFSMYFLCAFIAGCVAAVVTNPFDVTKTWLQTQHMEMSCVKGEDSKEFCKSECVEKHSNKMHYKDFMHTIWEIYTHEGPKGFMKGVIPWMILIAPSSAISWGTYEFFKHILTSKE